MVEFHDSETLRIVHIITEYGCAFSGFRILDRRFQPLLQSVAREDIVAQDHGNRVVSDKIRPDNECLRKSVGAWLYRIGQLNTELMPVS